MSQAPPLSLRHQRLRRAAPAVQHDINNAMMVLTSNLDLLNRAVPEGAPRRQLDRALQAMRRLEDTMRGYLDAARRETPDEAVMSPAAAVGAMLPLLRTVLGARHGVDATLPERVAPVRLDRARLDLALLAVAQDAMEAVPGGARIGLLLADGSPVTLTVTAPPGISAEAVELLRAVAPLQQTVEGFVLSWPPA